ncbi:MAG: deoxyribodipyrimidine photo-lyase [Syntrophobacterales bacterium]|nr:deoxyribodipyrimidine photo-lyase [Syntrophobacterales bacterium]
MSARVHPRRVRRLKGGPEGPGPVVYWLSRDQRARDNWALLFAQDLALEAARPLVAVFCLVPAFLGATRRQYAFMLRGLAQTAAELARHRIPLLLAEGRPEEEIPRVLARLRARALVTDFDPLRIKREWKAGVLARVPLPVYEVDAHNLIPCWLASPHQEWAAYSFRPKVRRALPEFLTDFPDLEPHPHPFGEVPPWPPVEDVLARLPVDPGVEEVPHPQPGEVAAHKALADFIARRLAAYPQDRNDPSRQGQSGLSPYLHFGQLAPQRAAWEVYHAEAPPEAKETFLEELIVRRELSDNFCYYQPRYDQVAGFPAWARKTLDDHRRDPREYLYSREKLEAACTHDDLWNAAQREMVLTGKMHGYLRMYWAKKILEWSPDPETALETAIYLNDRYELDGRDPNGYVGIAWSIGGVHDRAFAERPVFGKIRYMSRQSLARKLDLRDYLLRFAP